VFSTLGIEPVVWETRDGMREVAAETPLHVRQPLIQMVVDELRGVGRCPRTGESVARTSWVTDRLLEDYRQGRLFQYLAT